MSQFSSHTPTNQQGTNLRQTARFFIQQSPKIVEVNSFDKSPRSSISIPNVPNSNALTTSSKIILPAGRQHFNQNRKIRWVRCYSGINEKLYFMDDLLYFQCSPLDYDCRLEATIEYQNNNTINQDKLQYGPVILDTQSGVKIEGYQKTPIQCLAIFDGQTNHKVRQINMIFDNGIILQGFSPYALANDQILSIHITTVKDNMLMISGLNQRLLSQKVFNDGMWYQNSYQATKIKFHSHQAFLSVLYNVNRLKFSIASHSQKGARLSHKQFSPRLTIQRPSNLSSTQAMNTSPSNSYMNQKFSKDIKKSTISQNSPYIHNKRQNQDLKDMKKSQILRKNQKNSMALSSDFDAHPTSAQGQNDGSYIDQFDALFQDANKTEQLCLNDSFDQFEKKSALDGSQTAKHKIIEQKRVKQQQRERQRAKLQQKVNQLSSQNQKLVSINQRLKGELQILKDRSQQKGSKSLHQIESILNSLKRYQSRLQRDVKQLLNKVYQNSENLIRTSSVQQFKQNQDMTLSFSAKKGKQVQVIRKQIQKQFDVLSFQAKNLNTRNVNDDDELFQCKRS